ncbi:MAG: hypothetical protein HY098_08510 [Nitrospinae bacterium]|nr:hypothetical protein [Nitrospinota bacterium]
MNAKVFQGRLIMLRADEGTAHERTKALTNAFTALGTDRTHALPATICIDLTGFTVVPSLFLGLLGNYASSGDSPFARIVLIGASDGIMRRLSQFGLLSKTNRLRTVCDHAEAASLIFSGAANEFQVVAAD